MYLLAHWFNLQDSVVQSTMEGDVKGPLCVCVCWSSACYTVGHCRCVGRPFCGGVHAVLRCDIWLWNDVANAPPTLTVARQRSLKALLKYSCRWCIMCRQHQGVASHSAILFSVLHFRFWRALSCPKPLRLANRTHNKHFQFHLHFKAVSCSHHNHIRRPQWSRISVAAPVSTHAYEASIFM